MEECFKREIVEPVKSEMQKKGVDVNEIGKSMKEGNEKAAVRSLI